MKNIKILDNNIKYIHIENSDDKLFEIILNINVGSKYENKNNSGISHLIEHILFGSTKTIPIIEKLLDKYGMEYNASTDPENTKFFISCLNKYADIAIYIIYSMLFENLFDNNVIERERNIVLQEYNNLQDHINYIFDKNTYEIIFKNGLLDTNIIGNYNSLKNISRNDIINYINKYYTYNNITLCSSSNKPINTYYKLIDKLFNHKFNYKSKNNKFIEKNEIYNNTLGIYKQLKIKKENIYINISFKIEKYNLKHIIYYEFIKTILTDGLYSRLYKLLRTHKPLVYNINCDIHTYKYGGVFNIQTSVSNKNFEKVITLLINELIYNNNEFNKDEFENAKNKLILNNKVLENDHKLLSHYLLELYIYNNKLFKMSHINKLYNNITINNINKFYKKYFTKNNICILFTL